MALYAAGALATAAIAAAEAYYQHKTTHADKLVVEKHDPYVAELHRILASGQERDSRDLPENRIDWSHRNASHYKGARRERTDAHLDNRPVKKPKTNTTDPEDPPDIEIPMPKRYHTKSRYQNPYYGPKRKIDKLRKKGVVIESDETRTVTGSRTIYFGHYTHPIWGVQRIVCLSLAKLIGRVVFKHIPSSIEDLVGGNDGFTKVDSIIRFYFTSRIHEEQDLRHVEATLATGDTYSKLADTLYNLLADIINSTYIDDEKMIQKILVYPVESATGSLANMGVAHTFKAADLKIAVRGQSYMKYQNATKSEAGLGGSTDKHDINANPVSGRCYYGKGSLFALKRADDRTAGYQGGALRVDSRHGVGSFDVWSFNDNKIDRMLQFPPNYKMWYGLKHDRHVRMQPGTLSKSTLAKTHLLKLNQWLKIFQGELDTTAVNNSAYNKRTSIGVSRWYGVDKMIHDDADDNTTINVETHVRLVGCAYWKPRAQITAPYPAIPDYKIDV